MREEPSTWEDKKKDTEQTMATKGMLNEVHFERSECFRFGLQVMNLKDDNNHIGVRAYHHHRNAEIRFQQATRKHGRKRLIL